jgi:hypothetical protein
LREGESGYDLDGMEEVGKVPAWTRWRWRRRGVEVGAEEERAYDVDPMAVGEAIGKAPAWTQWRWRRHDVEAGVKE